MQRWFARIGWVVVMSVAVVRADVTVWQALDTAAGELMASVEQFAAAPDEAGWQGVQDHLDAVEAAWKVAAPAQTEAMLARRAEREIDSGEVGKVDLNDLIQASRCPVPFSRDMIRKLNVDMQGVSVLRYLVSETPDGATDAATLVALYQAQPRRAAYLASATALLKEKTAALVAEAGPSEGP
jgi:hypothetical protein